MMRLNAIAALAIGTALAALLAQPAPARAETLYPWCVQYTGGAEGIGAVSCAFVSKAQCEGTASGMRAMCVPNPAYLGPAERPHPSSTPHRRVYSR
jgi:hypothetical protein